MNTPPFDDIYFEDLPAGAATDRLQQVAVHVAETEAAIEQAEKVLASLKKEHRTATTVTIPSLMMELGALNEIKADWGTVKTTPFWSGKISPETEHAAFAWLELNNHGAIIKREMVVPVPKGDDEYAAGARSALAEAGVEFQERVGVHYQTLQAFIKSQALAGEPVPQDLFHVYTGVTARVSLNK